VVHVSARGMVMWCMQLQGAQRYGACSCKGHGNMAHAVVKAQQYVQWARSTTTWCMWVQGHGHVLSLPHVIAIVAVGSGAWWALEGKTW